MYRIYIAEDDEGIARAISKGLSGWELDLSLIHISEPTRRS